VQERDNYRDILSDPNAKKRREEEINPPDVPFLM